MSDPLVVLVTGATGTQGGSVARALAARGHQVRGLTRNVSSPKAQVLWELGIQPVAGDLTDGASLDAALAGVDSVFAMTTPFEAGEDAEVQQGKTMADAVMRAGVGHLVYTSVGGADRNTKIPHFETKWQVEQYLKEIDVPHTVIAPVYFMDNLMFPNNLEGLKQGRYGSPLPADRSLQQIASADIGAFGATVIERRDSVIGRRFDIAGDDLTGAEQAALLTEVLGRPIEYAQVPMEVIRSMSEDLALMYQWFIDVGYETDLKALHAEFPEVGWRSMKQWLSEQSFDS